MISLTKIFALTAAIAGAAASASVPSSASSPSVFSRNDRYKDHAVYRFDVQSSKQADVIQSILDKYETQLEIDSWSHGAKGKVDLMMPKSAVPILKSELFDAIPNTVFVPDVKLLWNLTPEAILTADQIFSDYQDLSVLTAFFNTLPGYKQVSLGKSYLGADIPGFTIGKGPKSIVFNGGIHAREWISVATTTYIGNWLATNPAASKLLDLFTFHVVPVLNVDGYAYTRSTDRLWRKNLQPNFNSTCAPAQILALPAYYGPSAFSVPESKAMADYVLKLGNVVSFMDFHAFSQLWLFSNGWTCTELIKDYAVVKAAGDVAVAALASVHNTTFTNGDICNTIYPASGSSVDWAYNVANIIPTGEETLAGMVALWNYIADYVYGTTPTTTTTVTPTTTTTATSTSAPTSVPTSLPTPPPVSLCLHDKCQIGGPLTTACADACVGRIIGADAYCGAQAWDPTCVRQTS
ncbi:hypothetical protein BC829DRAFT_442367 [Chytridium lagenaria]|nr:hypothetical protein BC829DRAFT_442367 [Chytridium lagenaria]